MTSSTCPVFQAECSPRRSRGKLVVVGSLCNTAAFCLSNWMNYGLYFHGGPMQWRFPLGFQLIFPVLIFICLPFIIDSPRWLLLRDRHEEAIACLARLRGKPGQINDEELLDEFRSIWKSLQEERADVVPIKDAFLFRDKTQNLRRVLLSCGTQFMQQFTGVNALGMSALPFNSRIDCLPRLLLADSLERERRVRQRKGSPSHCLQRYFVSARSFLLSTAHRSRR